MLPSIILLIEILAVSDKIWVKNLYFERSDEKKQISKNLFKNDNSMSFNKIFIKTWNDV